MPFIEGVSLQLLMFHVCIPAHTLEALFVLWLLNGLCLMCLSVFCCYNKTPGLGYFISTEVYLPSDSGNRPYAALCWCFGESPWLCHSMQRSLCLRLALRWWSLHFAHSCPLPTMAMCLLIECSPKLGPLLVISSLFH